MLLLALLGQKAAPAALLGRGARKAGESRHYFNTPLSILTGGRHRETAVALGNRPSILIPVDFSPDSLEAVKQSLMLARPLGAKLVLLHVVHGPSYPPDAHQNAAAGEKVVRHTREPAEERMAQFIKSNKLADIARQYGIQLLVRLRRGLLTTQILHAVEKEKAGLIAMGSSGRTGLARRLLGSTAEKVMRLTTVPVMVVNSQKNS